MASKFIALFALVAVASAQHYQNNYYQQGQYDNHYAAAPAVIKQYQPAIIKQVQPALIKKVAYEHEAPANYEFNYDVHDSHTGDFKQQHEVAKDGAVSGEYSLIDADGYRRIVSYTADDHHGFVANVRREPVEGHKIIAQPAVTKVIAQPAIAVQKYVAPAPVYKYAQAPVVQQYAAAPVVQKYVQAAPVVKYTQAPVVQQYAAAPVVQKYVQAAPVVEKYISQAPVVQKYVQAAPVVQKYVQAAPVVQKYVQAAPVVKHISGENSAHVSVHAPGVNYHY